MSTTDRKARRAHELAARREEKRTRRERERAAVALPPVDRLVKAREEYAAAWASVSGDLARGGHYAWMASLLPRDGGKVLEIGAGVGAGTLALVARGWRVVGVDENVACLEVAVARLEAEGVSVSVARRGKARAASPGVHAVDYAGAWSESGGSVTLVEGDILRDPDLDAALVAARPFDAITCWLLDTHDARACNEHVIELRLRDPHDYRRWTIDRVYAMAESLLRPGGLLHVVDRVRGVPDVDAASKWMRQHQNHAAGKSLRVESLDTRALTDEGSLVSVRVRRD